MPWARSLWAISYLRREVELVPKSAERTPDPACPHMCDSDVGEATLKIIGVSTEDDGVYTCIAVNDMGSASSSASLRVLGKPPGAWHLCRHPLSQCLYHTWNAQKLRTRKGYMSRRGSCARQCHKKHLEGIQRGLLCESTH